MIFVNQPTLTLGNIRPSADICQTLGKRVNIAICTINPADLQTKPVGGHMPKLMQVVVDMRQKAGMFAVTDAAKIGDSADIP